MHSVVGFVARYNVYILLGLAALTIFLLLWSISLSTRLSRISRRRSSRLADGEVGEIVESINDQTNAITRVERRLEEISDKQYELDKAMSSCFQKVGLVRFNAFDDMGGEQSFSMALLDARCNGLVLSSLHSRQDSRMYVKSIINGEGERPLSAEETKALKQALA